MQCHVIILDTTGTIHTFYEIEKRKETKKTISKEKKEENKKKQTVVPPPSAGDVANTLTLLGPQSRFGDKLLIIRGNCPHMWECGAKGVKRTSWNKIKKKKNTTTCKQSKTGNQGKNNKGKITSTPRHKAPPR